MSEIPKFDRVHESLTACAMVKMIMERPELDGVLYVTASEAKQWSKYAIAVETSSEPSLEGYAFRFRVLSIDETKKVLSKLDAIREQRN